MCLSICLCCPDRRAQITFVSCSFSTLVLFNMHERIYARMTKKEQRQIKIFVLWLKVLLELVINIDGGNSYVVGSLPFVSYSISLMNVSANVFNYPIEVLCSLFVTDNVGIINIHNN